jgi:putative pyoverdin transport system ATP-binding/permease protein
MNLISYLSRYSSKTVALAIVAGIISGACNTALLAIINMALKQDVPQWRTLGLAFMGLCVLLPLTRFASEMLLTHLGQRALLDLRLRLSSRILAAPLRHLETLGAHKLLATLTEDIPAITNAVLTVPLLCINTAIIIGGLIYLGWLSWAALLAVVVFMVLGILSYQIPVIKAGRSFRLARENGDMLLSHFRALTEGTKELKLNRDRRESFISQVLKSTAEHFRRNNIAGMRTYIAAASWGQTLVFFIIGLTLFALPALKTIGAPTMIGYTLILLYLMTPFQVLMNSLPTLGRASVAIRKVQELGLSLESQATEADSASMSTPVTTLDQIELRGVTHIYRRESEDDTFMLGPIDLTIHPGELLFIIGGNGSGKTTLAKLLMGLYAPEGGEIRFNGQKITDELRDYYRQYFSVVFSDFYLFDSLLGLEKANLDERTRQYLNQLQLNHKVTVKDGVLSTTDLSQGQRKRLALLTAYIEDRPVCLFDEWAADQDPVFKEVFYHELLPDLKARGKTVIIISHDDHYYHVADRIVKLDNGKIEFDRSAAGAKIFSTPAL